MRNNCPNEFAAMPPSLRENPSRVKPKPRNPTSFLGSIHWYFSRYGGSLQPVMISLLIATRNAHKTREIGAILGPEFRCLTLNDFENPPKVIEDAKTFDGNARKKAVELAVWAKAKLGAGSGGNEEAYVMADDSGLEVDALDGAPGVYSARFAATETVRSDNSPDEANNSKLLRLLREVPAGKRQARFRCVIALAPIPATELDVKQARQWCEAATRTFDGVCEGRIGTSSRGANGFGYDPLFLPNGYDQTFAELGDEVKNRISHRAGALAEFKRRWK
jgi:XTP/dITP diphosphohydrolase